MAMGILSWRRAAIARALALVACIAQLLAPEPPPTLVERARQLSDRRMHAVSLDEKLLGKVPPIDSAISFRAGRAGSQTQSVEVAEV